MSCPRSSTLLLLALPIVLLCAPPSSAHRVQKGGCLNYGHSCLGAHGKRASWHPDVRPSSRPPTVPRPLLDIFLNALSTPTRTGVQYPNIYASTNSVLGRRPMFPEHGLQTVPAMELLSEPDLEVKMGGVGGVLGGLKDDMENLGGRVHGSSDMDQDAVFYDGTLDDDYSDTRFKRNTSPQLARGRTSAGIALPKADGGPGWQHPQKATTVRDPAEHKDHAVRMMAKWLMR